MVGQNGQLLAWLFHWDCFQNKNLKFWSNTSWEPERICTSVVLGQATCHDAVENRGLQRMSGPPRQSFSRWHTPTVILQVAITAVTTPLPSFWFHFTTWSPKPSFPVSLSNCISMAAKSGMTQSVCCEQMASNPLVFTFKLYYQIQQNKGILQISWDTIK